MSLYVVDASIAVKVYVPEIHSAQAIRFFSDEHELIVPEFMLAEFANIVWKKSALLGELTEAEARAIVDAVQELPLGYYYEWLALRGDANCADNKAHGLRFTLHRARGVAGMRINDRRPQTL